MIISAAFDHIIVITAFTLVRLVSTTPQSHSTPSEALRIVSYWRDSLADSARQDIPVGTLKPILGWADGPYAVARDLLRDGVVPDPERVRRLLREAGAEDGQLQADVLICPLVARAVVVHGKRKATEDFVVPLYIPAILDSDGKLAPPGEGGPWIPRDRLEPGRDMRPVILGRVAAVDRFLSTSDPPDAAAGWRAYWGHAWRMLEAVAEDAGWRLSPDGFDPGMLGLAKKGFYESVSTGFVLPHAAAPGMIAPLMAVYDLVLKREVPPLLANFAAVAPSMQRPPLDDVARVDAHALHLGQMSDRHALAPSQREALHHALTLEDGHLLAINGPPGTGKTTLLQSVVASLWVRAALEEGEPPVILAVSTNNQAVTNVIESFGKAQQYPSSLAGRWVPDVSSFGLYCAAKSQQEAARNRFQVVSGSGGKDRSVRDDEFPTKVESESYVQRATTEFLERAGQAFGQAFASVDDCVRHLHGKLVECRATLEDGTRARLSLLRVRQEAESRFGTAELALLANDARVDADALEGELAEHQARHDELVEELRSQSEQAVDKARRSAHAAARPWLDIREKWEVFDAGTPGWIVLLSWFMPVRDHRRRLIRRFLQTVNAVPPAEVCDASDVDEWIDEQLTEVDRSGSATVAALNRALADAIADEHANNERFRAPRESRLVELRARLRDLADASRRLEVAVAAWERWVTERATEAAALDQPDRQAPRPTPEDALEVADRLTRVLAFQLATHYWEGRWLVEMSEQIESEYRETQSQRKQEKRWRRYAKLTPCLVSTLYKAPSFFTWWAGEKTGAVPFVSFIDLLIVDEAGQVPPELAGAAFALARRALVVGDTEQLRPVWRVSTWGDAGNLQRAGLRVTEDTADRVEKAGISAASGSVMRVAQRRSPYRIPDLPYGGMLLTEHYRCVPQIIAYCNYLCYRGRLRPVRPNDTQPPELPRMGYAHVPGASDRSGGSRINRMEASTIARWIAGHADALRQLGARARGLDEREPLPPLAKVVAVVTPFKAQARMIKAALEAQRIKGLTVDTVHALQGDERDVVVFSPVYTHVDEGNYYMLEDRALLNVAVSRAKESFLVFGDMGVFDRLQGSPVGQLAQHLFASRANELTDVEIRPPGDAGTVRKLAGLAEHQKALRDFFTGAVQTIRITSPWVTARAIREDGIEKLVADAVDRGVQVTFYVDSDLNRKDGRELPSAAEGKQLLAESGATVKVTQRIHNKTIAVDDGLICEGSFNWLSAVRRAESPFHRYERSLVYAEGAAPLIQHFLADIESRVVQTIRPGEQNDF